MNLYEQQKGDIASTYQFLCQRFLQLKRMVAVYFSASAVTCNWPHTYLAMRCLLIWYVDRINGAIARMDADVMTIETSRSQVELLDAFVNFDYPDEIRPGVYDIHSPCVPNTEEMVTLLNKAADVLPVRNLWVNPDCGLKTRRWPETTEALKNRVQAAQTARQLVGEPVG